MKRVVLLITGLLVVFCLRAKDISDTQECSFKWDGYKRTYLVHVPSNLKKGDSPALLIALHGGGGKAKGMITLTRGGLNSLADGEGFIVVYPQGYKKHWNDGRVGANDPANRKDIDDVGFISALIDRMIEEHGVDENRIYVTGISNGGMMSYRLACELSGRIAAIAPVATSMPINMPDACSPGDPMAVLIISGNYDPLIPFEGGEIQVGKLKRGRVISVPQCITYWVRHNGCSSAPEITMLPDIVANDGTRVRVEEYPGCQERGTVTAYIIEGGGHTWPGGLQYLGERTIGKTCRDIDANQVIWDFFKQHSR